MALNITLILVIAFFYVGMAFNYDVPGASGKGLQDFSLPVVNLFSEGIQNVSISGL